MFDRRCGQYRQTLNKTKLAAVTNGDIASKLLQITNCWVHTCAAAASACFTAAAASTASTSNLAKVAAVRKGDVARMAWSAGAASSTTSGLHAQPPTKSSSCSRKAFHYRGCCEKNGATVQESGYASSLLACSAMVG